MQGSEFTFLRLSQGETVDRAHYTQWAAGSAAPTSLVCLFSAVAWSRVQRDRVKLESEASRDIRIAQAFPIIGTALRIARASNHAQCRAITALWD